MAWFHDQTILLFLYVWHYQYLPGETHDMDEVFESVLIDLDGRRSLFKMGKLGILWQLDRTT